MAVRESVYRIRWILPLFVCFCSVWVPAQAPSERDERRTVRYLAWKDASGQVFSEAIEVAESDDLAQSYHLAIETPEQNRAIVSSWFVPSRDVALARFLDRTSGWEAELELKSGLGDLGDLSGWSHGSVRETMKRLREEGKVPVFTLDTPEIRLQAKDDTDEAGRSPIERLVTGLAESGVLRDLPATTRESLSFSVRVLDDSSVGGVARDLVTILAEALRSDGEDRGGLAYDDSEWLEGTGGTELVRDEGVSPAQRLLQELGPPPSSDRIEALRDEALEASPPGSDE